MTEQEIKADVERDLPAFVKAVNSPVESVLMHQDAFSIEECLLLGKAIKYAGFHGKNVHVVPGVNVPYV